MAEDLEKDKDLTDDGWLSNWEAQSIEECERDSNMDEIIRTENERSLQKLWLSFQNSALSIARLYKEGSQHGGVSLWVPFQNSASCVTVLHKDSQDAMKRAFDLGCQHGTQRRTRELFSWVRKKRRHMRREDIVAYLCGKPAPMRSHHHHLHKSNGSLARTPTRVSVGMDRSCSPRHSNAIGSDNTREEGEPDLQPFREALALQGLNGAMSNVSVGMGAPHSSQPGTDDFHCYILDEMSRRCEARKRSSSSDGRIDSPSRKRSRLWCNMDSDDI